MEAFQVAMLLVGALVGVVNLFVGIILNTILKEQREQRLMLREIETQYFPRDEFQRYEDREGDARHSMRRDIEALKIRLGEYWRGTNGGGSAK